jgi:hypothetical protein
VRVDVEALRQQLLDQGAEGLHLDLARSLARDLLPDVVGDLQRDVERHAAGGERLDEDSAHERAAAVGSDDP